MPEGNATNRRGDLERGRKCMMEVIIEKLGRHS